MIVYITDGGDLMGEVDFSQYVYWLIAQYKIEGKNWELILSYDFWGEQLLFPEVLTMIKSSFI